MEWVHLLEGLQQEVSCTNEQLYLALKVKSRRNEFFNVSESAIWQENISKKILSPTLLKWIHIDLEAINVDPGLQD